MAYEIKCKTGTDHDNYTAQRLCDAGNVSLACEAKLIQMIEDRETENDKARANLRRRFGKEI